jgi:hypothetical protein
MGPLARDPIDGFHVSVDLHGVAFGVRGMEVGDAANRPVRAKDSSPVREHWDYRGSRISPGTGRKGLQFRHRSRAVSYAPFRGSAIRFQVPSAYALGYYLAPLRGLAFAFQEAGVGSTLGELAILG